MNKVYEIGNLTKDLELKEVTSHKVLNFTIAVSRRTKDEQGNNLTDFFPCTVWDAVAESMAKFLHKGDKVAVVGRLQNREYESNGEKRYVTEIIAEEVEFLNTKKKEEEIVGKHPELKPVDNSELPF